MSGSSLEHTLGTLTTHSLFFSCTRRRSSSPSSSSSSPLLMVVGHVQPPGQVVVVHLHLPPRILITMSTQAPFKQVSSISELAPPSAPLPNATRTLLPEHAVVPSQTILSLLLSSKKILRSRCKLKVLHNLRRPHWQN